MKRTPTLVTVATQLSRLRTLIALGLGVAAAWSVPGCGSDDGVDALADRPPAAEAAVRLGVD